MKANHLKIHHLGIAVAEIEPALVFYQNAFGFSRVSEIFLDPIQKVSVCFLGNHEDTGTMIELISPADSASPINGYLSKGIGAYHICYEVDHLEVALDDMRARGCILLGPPAPAVAFGGRKIAWCCTPTKHLVEFVESE